jgi:hypothetical protein
MGEGRGEGSLVTLENSLTLTLTLFRGERGPLTKGEKRKQHFLPTASL